MLAAALGLTAAGMVLVRLGWGGRRGIAVAGWAAALAGVMVAGWVAGAWGIAIATLGAMATALAAVALAGWRSPVRHRRAPRRAPSVDVPIRLPDLARRVAVFVLVVPVGFVAAEALALALRGVALAQGAAPADATMIALLGQPITWGVLMTMQMTRAGPARMLAAPFATAAAAALLGWAA